MKTLYFDCGMGAAGDMLTAALLELTPDPAAALARLNGLGIPGVTYEAVPSRKCGVLGTHVTVRVRGEAEEDHDHRDDHDHDHRSPADVAALLARLDLPERVRGHALAVYDLIADAESRVHGVPVTEIHFHEVGALDAVADVAAFCLLLDLLAPDRICASPIRLGSGTVRCAHGLLPVPAPATALLLEGLPVYGGDIPGELCTPTGAALLRHFVTDFGPLPPMRPSAVGCGMGARDFPAANCVRAFLGESDEPGDVVTELTCAVDDMTAEEIAFAAERILAGGALDVYTVAAGMKKGRPGTLIRALCRPEDRDKVAELFFRHTTTLGLRESRASRLVLRRRVDQTDTPLGPVRVKRSAGHGVERTKIEFEDLARIARERDVSLAEARRLAEEALR